MQHHSTRRHSDIPAVFATEVHFLTSKTPSASRDEIAYCAAVHGEPSSCRPAAATLASNWAIRTSEFNIDAVLVTPTPNLQQGSTVARGIPQHVPRTMTTNHSHRCQGLVDPRTMRLETAASPSGWQSRRPVQTSKPVTVQWPSPTQRTVLASTTRCCQPPVTPDLLHTTGTQSSDYLALPSFALRTDAKAQHVSHTT